LLGEESLTAVQSMLAEVKKVIGNMSNEGLSFNMHWFNIDGNLSGTPALDCGDLVSNDIWAINARSFTLSKVALGVCSPQVGPTPKSHQMRAWFHGFL
jgi:hypothetical protein